MPRYPEARRGAADARRTPAAAAQLSATALALLLVFRTNNSYGR
jgi:predicted membrane chloride channel (bestrophin family)